MAFKDLREWIGKLEESGELKRIGAEVDWDLEMGAITRKMMDKSGPALLFENIKGYNGKDVRCGKLVTATLGASRRLTHLLDLPEDTPMGEMIKITKERFGERIKPILVNTGPVKENILKGKDILIVFYDGKPNPDSKPVYGTIYEVCKTNFPD